MDTQRSEPLTNEATSVYKVYLITQTVSSALTNPMSCGINFSSGGCTLPYNNSYYKSLPYQPAAKC